MQAKEYVLDERTSDQPIDFGPAASHLPIRQRIVPGAVATVKLHGVAIDLEVLEKEHADTWVGYIRGFEGHAGRPMKGLAVGDVVRFHPQHVFACEYAAGQQRPIGPGNA